MKKINESSGYIPKNSKEANDPRWSLGLSNDVRPGEIERQAKKMGWATDVTGKPPLLHKTANRNTTPNKLHNLGLAESSRDVQVQMRDPVSPGARGLAFARSKFGDHINKTSNRVASGAADALAWALTTPTEADMVIHEIADKFKMAPDELARVFHKNYGMSINEFARMSRKKYMTEPKKI